MGRLVLAVLAWIPFGLYLAGFWPGVMTFDSLSQWAQATGRLPWTDVHPAVSTVGFWIAVKAGSPAVLAGAQSAFLAWAVVSFGRSVLMLGAPAGAVLGAIAAVVLAPSVGLFSVTLWKDVPFTAAALMLGAEVLRLMAVRLRLLGDDTPGAQLIALRAGFLRAVGWATFAMLLRQNGVVLVMVVMAAVAAGFPRLRRRAAASVALFPVAFLVLRLFVWPGLGVNPAPKSVVYVTVLHEIAAYAKHAPEAFSEEDWRILDSYAPAPVWGAAYDCTSAHPFLQAAGFRPGAVDRWPGPLRSVWGKLLRRKPTVAIGHRLCAAELAWHPFGRDGSWFFSAGRAIERNAFGLKSEPLDDRLDEWLNAAVSLTEKPGLRPFFWRAPIWIGLALVVLIREGVRRRRPLWLVAAAPLVGQQLMVGIANPGQDARYMAAAGIAAVLLLPLALRGETEELLAPPIGEEAPPVRKPFVPG